MEDIVKEARWLAENGVTEFSGTMTGQAADHFTADLPDADESSVVEAKAQEIAPAD